jgi:hypothetical protein
MALHEPLMQNNQSGRNPFPIEEWKIISREFNNVLSLTEESQISLFILLFPRKEHIYLPLSNHPRGHQVTRTSHNGAKEHILLLLQEKSNVPLLDITEHFWNIAPETGPLYNTIDGHFNERGNEEVAKFILNGVPLRLDPISNAPTPPSNIPSGL